MAQRVGRKVKLVRFGLENGYTVLAVIEGANCEVTKIENGFPVVNIDGIAIQVADHEIAAVILS